MKPETHRPGTRLLRRYAPIVGVVVVIAVVVVFGGGSEDSDDEHKIRAHGGLPLTFDEAKAQGKQVQWGPTCDTDTGRVAVPLSYSPPCVEPFSADNGGATAPGVTADTITIAVYQAQPDVLQQAFFEQSGSDESLAAELETVQQYVDVFSSYYELYGRTVELVAVKGSGPPDDDIAAKSDAIKVATEIKAFASFGGPGQTAAYADELAARGVLCIGDCVLAQPNSFITSRAPHVWPTLASPEQASEHWAAFVGRALAGRKASRAGDPQLQAEQRRFGIVRYDDEPGTFDRSFQRFQELLDENGVDIDADIPYQYDLERAQESARTVIAQLKDKGITSVILAGDPIFPLYLTREATAQDYFPEWVLMGYAFSDTAVISRTYDQEQWRHAFGVTLLPTRAVDEVDELASILTWAGGPPVAKTFRVLVQAPIIFFTGAHLAGPDLTAETFRDGLFRFPDRPPLPASVRLSWGDHGVWPGDDYTASDDAAVIWWDPDVSGPDEVGNVGPGLYRYALGGKRYLPDEWQRDVGLYDVDRSVTVLTELPADGRPPDYPSPAAG